MTGTVTLVGAGPGGKALLTLGGAAAIGRADAVVYDRLVSVEILALIPEDAVRVDVGKTSGRHPVPQDEINRILVSLAREGKQVVRLKGGDCYLFGRGGEECEYLRGHGVPFRVLPGVTSALAAPAFAGIPVTHRDFCSSVHIVTAHAQAGRPLAIDFEALVRAGGTLVFLMGLAALEQVADGLLRTGLDPETPAAVIESGARSAQRKVVVPVRTLAAQVRAAGLRSPALIVVGRVCALSDALDWWTALPLHGRTVAVTRPKGRGAVLADGLRALGAEVLETPCIEIREREDVSPLAAALAQAHDWAVFTSPAGVRAAVHALRRLGRDLRALYGMRLAAIGAGTAAALAGYGLTADLVPEQYDSAHLADALLAREGGQGAALLLRAAQGSSLLPERLRAGGFRVTDVPLYDTVYRCAQAERLRALLDTGKLDAVTFTSGSTVQGFVDAVGAQDFSAVTALCIGSETARQAAEYGFRVRIAENATEEDMIRLFRSKDDK